MGSTVNAGTVTTLAGNGNHAYADGVGTASSFYNPEGISVDSNGLIFVADTYNHLLRKIELCGSGLYFSGTSCVMSPLGYYAPGTGLYFACAAGWYASSVGSTDCTPCSADTYSSSSGSASCVPCPTGKFAPAAGSSFCMNRPTMQPSSQPSSQPTPSPRSTCPAGYYLDQWCRVCSAGSYSTGGTSTSCTLAAIG